MSHFGSWHTPSVLTAIMATLGSTKASLWPFLEKTGTLVAGISVGDLVSAETGGAAEALEDDFAPFEHIGKVCSYHFHPTGDHHLAGVDNAAFTFGNGTVDVPFSVGAWIQPTVVTAGTIISKFNAAGDAEEWRLFIDSNSKLSLELHDASESAKEVGVTESTLSVGQWVFVVATYDGGETAPVVTFYLDGVADGDGTTAETGAYVAMEDTATPLLVGADGTTAMPANEFAGRIALPFVTGKALSATEVATLYDLGKVLLGIF